MKKVILSAAMLIGLSVAVTYGQGNVFLNNGADQNGSYTQTYSAGVTSGGLVFTLDAALQLGTAAATPYSDLLYGGDVNVAIFGGTTAGSASPVTGSLLAVWLVSGSGGSITTYAANNGYTYSTAPEPYNTVQSASGIVADAGVIADPSLKELEIPGVSGSPAFLDILIWEGTASSYNSATTFRGTTGVFSQAVTTGGSPGPNSTGMPDVLLTPVPEPTTMALGALGGLSLLLFRRKQS